MPTEMAKDRRARPSRARASGVSSLGASPAGALEGSGLVIAEDTGFEEGDTQVEVVVDEALAGARLDAALAGAHEALSRNRIKDLILAGAVSIDGRPVGEPKYRLKAGETITLLAPPPEDPEPAPENIALDIVFEDEHLIVVNQPAGMVV